MAERSTLRVDEPRVRAARDVTLEVVDGPDRGKRIGPTPCPIRVGASAGNDLQLTDPTVSRFHFSVEARDRGPAVVDQASSNGTWLGDHAIKEITIGSEVHLRVGRSGLRLSANGRPRIESVPERTSFGRLVAESVEMRRMFTTLEKLTRSTAPVLVEGETGTGKELVARALHEQGPNPDAPFVIVDCGAASPSLIEAELFGHERGAYTGADEAREGALRAANGGTLFLDEVGELPLSLQPKLLRALETGQVKRLGSPHFESVSFRLVAATHRDLRSMVNEGSFREDLFFRLTVVPIRVPPLRERPEDIRVLTRRFLARALGIDERSPEVPEPNPETIGYLSRQRWPGNVRELRNLVDRAVAVADDDDIRRGDLLPGLRVLNQAARDVEHDLEGLEEARRRFEIAYIRDLLKRHDGQLQPAAKEAQIHPKSLQRLLRRHGIKRTEP
jgi:DNA-binding NtrC family response regulator